MSHNLNIRGTEKIMTVNAVSHTRAFAPASLDDVETVFVDADLLIIGGGNAGCFVAVEAGKLRPDARVVIVEKAEIHRSGACSAGMDAINTYIPPDKTPEDLVRWSRAQVGGGPLREDLALSNARELNEAVEDLERWGVPFLRDEQGNVRYRGKWDISIHGEQLKPIMAEQAIKSGAQVYNRIAVTALLMRDGKCCGAVFSQTVVKHCHHVNNMLPLDRINKVPNLAWLCAPCHRMVHNSPIPPDTDTKTVRKIKKYREKLSK